MRGKQEPNVADDLLRIHRVVTRAIDVAGAACATYREGGFPDAATRTGLVLYVQTLVGTLHGHHTGEDELAFPYLKGRIPTAPYDELMKEHQVLQPILASIRQALDGLKAGHDEALANLQDALGDLKALWHPHIDTEQDHFNREALAAVMKAEEHIELARTMAAHAQKVGEPGFLTLPFLLFNLQPDDREAMAALIPPEVTGRLIPVVWKEMWAPMQPFLLQ